MLKYGGCPSGRSFAMKTALCVMFLEVYPETPHMEGKAQLQAIFLCNIPDLASFFRGVRPVGDFFA
jgi:hypothetical protein